MSEVQNYFFKNYQKQASESLSHSLQNYLLQVYRKSLTSEEKVCQSGNFNELKASSCHKSSKINSNLRTPSNNMNDNYELHSENSDLGFNYSSGLTDDEMTEHYSNVDSKDNSEVIESYLFINSVSSVQDIPYNDDNNINPTEHVWRPW